MMPYAIAANAHVRLASLPEALCMSVDDVVEANAFVDAVNDMVRREKGSQ